MGPFDSELSCLVRNSDLWYNELFRLHVHRNPRVFCCQVNMTSLWNLDLSFADGCEIVIYTHFHVGFLTDHHGFIVNISFIHFSVEDDSV